jgi:hypothetical protein
MGADKEKDKTVRKPVHLGSDPDATSSSGEELDRGKWRVYVVSDKSLFCLCLFVRRLIRPLCIASAFAAFNRAVAAPAAASSLPRGRPHHPSAAGSGTGCKCLACTCICLLRYYLVNLVLVRSSFICAAAAAAAGKGKARAPAPAAATDACNRHHRKCCLFVRHLM